MAGKAGQRISSPARPGINSGRCARPVRRAYPAIRKVSRLLPSASSAVSQRGALPRPLQVSQVLGWRYLGATFRLAAGAVLRPDVARGVFEAPPEAAALSSAIGRASTRKSESAFLLILVCAGSFHKHL